MKTEKTDNPVDIDLRTTAGKIDMSKLIELRIKGLSGVDIGKHFNCTPQAVYQALDRYKTDPAHLKSFKDNKADVYEFIQGEVINSVTPECINKTPFTSRIVALGILEDKIRLIRGQSTGNISVKSTVEHYANKLEEINKVLAEIE